MGYYEGGWPLPHVNKLSALSGWSLPCLGAHSFLCGAALELGAQDQAQLFFCRLLKRGMLVPAAPPGPLSHGARDSAPPPLLCPL